MLFGLTDYCYWLYITDLGVDRDYEDIAVCLIANEDAVPFYEKLGLERADDVMKYNHIEWTEWTVK